jgi:hypothetical protein
MGAIMAICLVAGATGVADAQSRWQQTVQAITPVVQDEITGALLDSLIEVAGRTGVPIRRSPDDASEHTMAELSDLLLDEGLDVTSANQVFITYKYEADPRSFKSEIVELYFIYRPVEYEDADTPIAIVDATNPIVRNMLVSNGTQLESNEAVFEPFWDQLRLHQLENGTIVKVGGKILRDDAEAQREKERLLQIIQRFLY